MSGAVSFGMAACPGNRSGVQDVGIDSGKQPSVSGGSGMAVFALVQMACEGEEKPGIEMRGHGGLSGAFFVVVLFLFVLSGDRPAGGEESVRRVCGSKPRRKYVVEVKI